MAAAPTPPLPLREVLASAALGGAGWGEVLGRFAESTGAAVRLVAADGAVLCEADRSGVREFGGAQTFDADRRRLVADADVRRVFTAPGPVVVECLDGQRACALGVRAGQRRVGLILVAADTPSAADRLQDAATAVAIVAVRRDAEASAVAETASWFVDELRFGTSRAPDDLRSIGRRFGVDLATPQVGIEIRYDGSDVRMFATALAWLETPVRREGPRAWTVGRADRPDRPALIARRLQSMVSDGAVRVAAGSGADDPAGIMKSFVRARFALAYAASIGRTGAIAFADLGPAGLLSELPRTDLELYVRSRLGPVLDRPDLLETLRQWCRSGGSWRAVAEATHIHRNSVGHRIERIRALLGVDPAAYPASFDLQLALTGFDVLAVADAAD